MISIVIPVGTASREELRKSVDSVFLQISEDWELILLKGEKTDSSAADFADKVSFGEHVRIAEASGDEDSAVSAAAAAFSEITGEYVFFLRAGDTVSEKFTEEVSAFLSQDSKTTLLYCDDDICDKGGRALGRLSGKPDYSPDTLLSFMYMNDGLICDRKWMQQALSYAEARRKELCSEEDAGAVAAAYEAADSVIVFFEAVLYDAVLRITEKLDKSQIGHIRKVLYFRSEKNEYRRREETASGQLQTLINRIQSEALARRNISAHLEPVQGLSPEERIVYDCPDDVKVSIVILSKDHPSMLEECLESIRRHTQQLAYETIVVDNGSTDENRNKILGLSEEYDFGYYYQPEDFNFSALCNFGAKQAKGNLLLFLNDDIKVLSDGWLMRMAGQALLPYAGAVGAKLLYPESDRIQHIGIVNGKNGPTHLLMGRTDDCVYDGGRNRLTCNCLAVTGACLMVEKSKYDQVGGMNPEYAVAYNDVDLCLRLLEAGYENAVRNDSVLVHYESVTRGKDADSTKGTERLVRERNLLYTEHPVIAEGWDPYYQSVSALEENEAAASAARPEPADIQPLYDAALSGLEEDSVQIEEVYELPDGVIIRGQVRSGRWQKDCMDAFLLLTGKNDEQFRISLDKSVWSEENRNSGPRSFLFKLDNDMLNRERTAYRLSYIIFAARSVEEESHASGFSRRRKESHTQIQNLHMGLELSSGIPGKKARYPRMVRCLPEKIQTVYGEGVSFRTFDLEKDGTLNLEGAIHMAGGKPGYRKVYLAAWQTEQTVYYELQGEYGKTFTGFRGQIPAFSGQILGIAVYDLERRICILYPVRERALRGLHSNRKDWWNVPYYGYAGENEKEFFADPKKFTIFVILKNPVLMRHLPGLVESVKRQDYPLWNLVLIGTEKTGFYNQGQLEDILKEDTRIRLRTFEEENRMADLINREVQEDESEFICFVGQDDRLAEQALSTIMRYIRLHRQAACFYSDEVNIDETGQYLELYRKPSFNPDFACTSGMMNRLLVIRKDLFEKIGGVRNGYLAALSYDLVLRCIEQAKEVVHIPEVLYHYRKSTVKERGRYRLAEDRERLRAIREHFERTGSSGAYAERMPEGRYLRMHYPVKDPCCVTVIIPCLRIGNPQSVRECIKSVTENTTYKNYEVLLLGQKDELKKALGSEDEPCKEDGRIRVIDPASLPSDMNAALKTAAEQFAEGSYIIKLQHNCLVKTADWIEQLLSNCQRQEIGAVCGKCSMDNVVISCGLQKELPGEPCSEYENPVEHLLGHPLPINCGLLKDDPGYMGRAAVQQNVEVVSGECFMTSREEFIRTNALMIPVSGRSTVLPQVQFELFR